MIDRLPASFLERMTRQLGVEAPAFINSYEAPRTHGLRLNTLKLNSLEDRQLREEIARFAELFGLEPVPWCPTGYYYDEETRPGKHPYHAAGLYYIQEPSAMSAVELLDPKPGETVLDLAAAPGGKTTQIAGSLAGSGLLIANEIHPARAKILAENVERMGIANAIVANAAPDALADRFPQFFDAIMLDAPCSGEGMFRKDLEAIGEWSEAHVSMCAARQSDILEHAVRMLKPGGLLAYSTCTFNEEENERTIDALIACRPELRLLRTERIWPHRQRGEGHFVALLQKSGETIPGGSKGARGRASSSAPAKKRGKPDRGLQEAEEAFRRFSLETVPDMSLPDGEPLLFGEQLYWLPADRDGRFQADSLRGLRTPRPGLHLGAALKGRFEPAHALALSLARSDDPASRVSFPAESPEIAAYLRGETLALPPGSSVSGWVPVCVDGYPLGWGKASGGTVKNHYPKGLRRP